MIGISIAPPHSHHADSESATFRPFGAEMDENGTKKLEREPFAAVRAETGAHMDRDDNGLFRVVEPCSQHVSL